jgi:hypothetical protein
MNLKPTLLGLLVTTAALRAAASLDPKWHPGHYVFLGTSKLTSEVLTLSHFRGVQRVYTWRDFEPEMGRYDFAALKADLALAKKHGRQLVVQFSFKSFAKGMRNVPDYLTGAECGGSVYVTTKGSLKLNYLFWSANPANCLDNVKKLLAEPDLAGDPAGGLESRLPLKAFLRGMPSR